ncbi:MAG: ATP-grasp domain-containing protein [Chloroflexi bacterium]|nr:ATP-grasp domain-containing protein [Chloroflexota bacterium]
MACKRAANVIFFSLMAALLVLYPAYGSVSCHEISRWVEGIEGLKLILADDGPTDSDVDIFDEVMELPPPQNLAESYELLRRWCDKRRPDGIFLQSERGLLLGALLVREFGLKGPSVEAAHICSNKYLQRVTLSRAGIGSPLFKLAESAADVHRLANDFGFPLVLKCVISTMSRLVTLVSSRADIDSAVAKMLKALPKSPDVARLLSFAKAGKVELGCDPKRQFLVESFLAGDMVETDGLALEGGAFTFGVTEQMQSVAPPFFIEGYLFPAECSDNRPIEAVSDATIKAVGLRDSAFSIEMRLQGNDIRIIEVNGRLGWDDGFSEMFQVRTRQERILQALQLSLGIRPELVRDESLFAALAYHNCYYNGIVEDLPLRDELARLECDGLKIGLSTHRGARFVAPPNPNAYPHAAWALATHPSSSRVAYQLARRAVDGLDITIKRI